MVASMTDTSLPTPRFKPGDIIQARNAYIWETAIVRTAEPWHGVGWYTVSFRNPDGGWAREHRLVATNVKAAGE
jgi:hypothetical protein